jgi:hypothetical protein
MPTPLVLSVASASVIVLVAWPNAAAALRDELPVTNIQILAWPSYPLTSRSGTRRSRRLVLVLLAIAGIASRRLPCLLTPHSRAPR